MNIQIFGKSKCFDTKKAERYFKERRIKYQFVDINRYGMSRGELNAVKNAVGIALPLQQGGIHLYGELPGGKAVGNALNAAQVERQVMP